MKRIKSVFIILLTCVLSFNFLIACGDRGKTEEDKRFERLEGLLNPLEPIEITVWHYYTQNIYTNFKNAVSDFNATVGAEKGIFVSETPQGSAETLSNSIIKAKNNDIGADPLPDIFQAYIDTVYEVGQESVAELDKYFRESEIEQYVDVYIKEGRFNKNDALQILPIAKSTEALVINKKAWEAFEAAENEAVSLSDLETVEGLADVAGKFYKRYNKAFFGRDSFANYFNVGLKQLGYDIFTETENGVVEVCENKSAYKKLWDNMYKPVLNGSFMHAKNFRTNEMQNEQVIAFIGSTASAGYIPAKVIQAQGQKVTGEDEYENEAIILPLPVFEGGEKVNVLQGAGLSVLSSDEKREYASAVFLKWFTENERNLQFATATGYSPVKKTVSGFDALSRSDAYNSAYTKPNVKKMLEVVCSMNTEYTLYYTVGLKNGATIRDTLLSTKNFDDNATLKLSMDYRCVNDLKKLKEGSATLDTLLSDANFDKWYEDLIAAIKQKINEQ